MTDLIQKKCLPCTAGATPLSREEAATLLSQVPEWTLGGEGTEISRTFRFPDFKGALAFANRVGDLAEEEGHHPDLLVSWGKVKVLLSTHAIKGLSENDFILAAKIDALPVG